MGEGEGGGDLGDYFTASGEWGICKLFSNQIFGKETFMKNREKLLGEIFELALQHDMNYFG